MDFLWIVYLGFLATSVIAFLIQGKYNTIRTKADFLVSVITWVGLFGYVTETPFLTPLVWKAVFVFAILWDITFTFIFGDYEYGYAEKGKSKPYGRKEMLPLWSKLFGISLILPLYYGLYQYAF
ncbi:hypothetical protein ACFQPF_04100 [Fictibacillus iocasae]|uniref:Uncharacterized protein n=1 Tax=Fictibacillus iocasae TaxID=2715437 RepID=A0ABW2NNY7_9BACL